MDFVLAVFSTIAANAKTPMTISNMIGKTSTSDAIEVANRMHNRIFAIYMLLLVLVAIFSYLVWNSGNRVQMAIQQDADARIEEAKKEGAKANERAKSL